MSDKSIVIVDPHFRRMDEIFSPEDRARLYDTVEVVWGKDEPNGPAAAPPAKRRTGAGVALRNLRRARARRRLRRQR